MVDHSINLRKFVAPEIVFGVGARNLAGQYARNFGASKVMIVSDPGVQSAGWLKDIEESVEAAGLDYVTYTEVTPNPRSDEVMTGASIYQNENCNAIVSVGGGSPMDCAKGIGIVCTNQQHILEFEGVDNIRAPAPPLILIPTTAGTSADVSQFSIITNLEERIKIAIVSKAIVPDVALVDPMTTTTMDPYLTACTGMDAIVHAVEAFVSTASSHMTDLYALEAIRRLSSNLRQAVTETQNLEVKEHIMLGSMEAGLAFSNAILGAVHAMAHSLGGFLDLPHGECNALLLEHVIQFNFDSVPERFKAIANAFGIHTKGMTSHQIRDRLIKEIKTLKRDINVTNTLGSSGVGTSDIPELSQKATKDACILTNPREANQRDIEVIYEEAL